MGAPTLEALSDWEGDVDQLAHLGGQLCAMLRIDERADLSVRLLRDYAQRGILDRPRREGKTAVYGWEHIVRLLAARLLLKDGWPLQKIADEFTTLSLPEIRALLPGAASNGVASATAQYEKEDPALGALRNIRARNAPRAGLADHRMAKLEPALRAPPISNQALLRRELAASLQTLGERTVDVRSHTYTRLEITSGVELNIETTRLRSLGRADAHAIAQAVFASLLNPSHRKEDKTE